MTIHHVAARELTLVDRLRVMAAGRDDHRAQVEREAADRIEQLEREAVTRELEITLLRRAIAPTLAVELGLP
jgi:hypothetical protein